MRGSATGAWGYWSGALLCLLGCNAKSSNGPPDANETSSGFPSGGSTTTGGGSGVFVDQPRDQSIRKLDLLLVLDNGPSMAEKQRLLTESVGVLLRRQVSPDCVTTDADQDVGNPALLQRCPPHEQRKLQFVGDNTPAAGSLAFIACAGAPLLPEDE